MAKRRITAKTWKGVNSTISIREYTSKLLIYIYIYIYIYLPLYSHPHSWNLGPASGNSNVITSFVFHVSDGPLVSLVFIIYHLFSFGKPFWLTAQDRWHFRWNTIISWDMHKVILMVPYFSIEVLRLWAAIYQFTSSSTLCPQLNGSNVKIPSKHRYLGKEQVCIFDLWSYVWICAI